MANIDDYNARLSDIKAIPDEETLEPGIPVDVALQEAENLHHWSLNDATALAVVGITSDMINDLPVRAGACARHNRFGTKTTVRNRKPRKNGPNRHLKPTLSAMTCSLRFVLLTGKTMPS